MKIKNACDLQTCFLCRHCLQSWQPAIDAHRKNFRVGKGDLVFREGDPVTGIFFVFEGAVKIHKQWGQYKELIVRFARKGDLFGHRGLGDPGKALVYPISATVLEPSVVCFVDLTFFRESLDVNRRLTQSLIDFYATELQESERQMRNLAHMPVRGRLAQSLLYLREKFGCTAEGAIDLNLSRQDLASFAGTTYETAFRVLNEFARDGWISLSGKDIRIVEPDQLAAQSSTPM